MTLPKNVAELQGKNVVFELECIDRMYLNLYVPQLASAPGVAAYFRGYKGHRFASTKEAVAMSEGFRRQVFDFAERHGIPIIRFEKGMRKDARIIRPGLSVIPSASCPQDLPMVRAFHKLQSEIDAYIIQKAA